jgi:hypothetical protein
LAQFGDVGLNPVIDYDRLEEIERLADEAQIDIAVRRARRDAGAEPEMWKAPEREPAKAEAEPEPDLLTLAMAHTARSIEEFAGIMGEETARAGEKLGAKIEAKVMAEVRNSALAMANKLMMQREVREQGQRAAEENILRCRQELADLRDELRALKAGGGAPDARAWTNGTGARQ